MTIYHYIYLVLTIFTLFDVFISRSSKKILLPIMITMGIFIIILAGIRWQTGTDWPNYLRYFNNIERVNLWGSSMEIGYEFLVRAFKLLFGNRYTPFLFFCAIFIVSLTYRAVYINSPYPIFSLFLLFSYSFVASGFGVRQDLSIALTLLSMTYIEQRSFYKFALLVFIASLIHSSAIIFFPAYYIYQFKWNVISVLSILFIIIVGGYLSENIMATIGPLISERKTEAYLELGLEATEDPYTSLVKGLISRFLFLILCIPLVNYKNEDTTFNGVFNIYVFGVVLYIIFTPISPVFSRIARSYEIFQILIFPLAYVQANRFYKVVLFTVVFVFSIYKFSSVISSDAGVYVPYKTIFTE